MWKKIPVLFRLQIGLLKNEETVNLSSKVYPKQKK